VARDIARDLSTAGRVSDVNRALEVKRLDEFGDVGGIGVHIVSEERLLVDPTFSCPLIV
jgi:hypothetical protein